jgi:hypothetical protein
VVNAVTLPHPRDLERILEDMEQLAATNGLTVKPVKMLLAMRDGPSVVQPVELKVEGTFTQTVAYLQALRAKFPAALLDACDMLPPVQITASAPKLRSRLTVNVHLQKDDKKLGEVLMPTINPDLVGSLADVARLAEGKFAFVGMSITVAGAAEPPGATLKPVVRVQAIGPSDVEITDFVEQLSQNKSGQFADVSLIVTDTMDVTSHSVRRFHFKFRVPEQKREGRVAGEIVPVTPGDIPDPFRAPHWMRGAASQGAAPPRGPR